MLGYNVFSSKDGIMWFNSKSISGCEVYTWPAILWKEGKFWKMLCCKPLAWLNISVLAENAFLAIPSIYVILAIPSIYVII